VSDRLHDLSTERRWDKLSEHVTDEMVDTFSVEADWPDLREAVKDRYDHVDRVSLYTPFDGADH